MSKPFYAASPAYRSLASRDRANFWTGVAVRIALAGGWYPIVLLIAWGVSICLNQCFRVLANGSDFRVGVADLASLAIGSVFGGVAVFFAGFTYAGVIAMFVVGATNGTLRLLCESPPRDAIGAFCGSAVAFIATLPAWLFLAANGTTAGWSEALFVWLHLSVAVGMGQVAGLLAAVPETRRRARGRLTTSPFELTLWRLMAGMVPLSVGLTLLRATNLLSVPMAVAGFAVLITGWVLRRPIAWAVNRWFDRHRRRRREARILTRST